MNRPNITLKIAKKLIKTGQFDKLYRSKEIEAKYQARDKNQDPINNKDKSIEFRLNNFPYQWEPGIEHWMLWYNGKWEELETNYQKWITFNYSLAWINPPEKRSMSNFPHVHILVRKKYVK